MHASPLTRIATRRFCMLLPSIVFFGARHGASQERVGEDKRLHFQLAPLVERRVDAGSLPMPSAGVLPIGRTARVSMSIVMTASASYPSRGCQASIIVLQMATSGKICCTVRLLKELGIAVNSCPKPGEAGGPFEEWYAAMFYSESKKCILFFNAASTLSAVALYVKRAEIREIGDLARRAVGEALAVLDLPASVRAAILDCLRTVQICKTDDKSTLACMNQVIFELKHSLAAARVGYKPATEANLSYTLNAVGFVRYQRPTKTLEKILADLGWEPAPAKSLRLSDVTPN